MTTKHRLIRLCTIAAIGMLSACTTPKNITYMQDFNNGQEQKVAQQRRITVQPDDKLSILVSSKDPELAQVFNLVIAQNRIGQATKGSSGNSSTAAFTVNPDGSIDYPLIGSIHIAGLERSQVAELIKSRIIEKALLQDPIVTVEFLNATVSVLGDVASPGEYTIDRENLNVIQAISKAGDLAITGMRTNVLVVREENGMEKAYRLDLTDTESLFSSPAYYLQQNDIVYVEPNGTKKRQSTANGNSVLTPGFWISIASFLTTIAVLIFK